LDGFLLWNLFRFNYKEIFSSDHNTAAAQRILGILGRNKLCVEHCEKAEWRSVAENFIFYRFKNKRGKRDQTVEQYNTIMFLELLCLVLFKKFVLFSGRPSMTN
jgi:hypothetical protein